MSGLTPAINAMYDQMESMERNRKTALGYASVLHERLMDEVRDFEQDLAATEELGCLLAAFGREVQIRIDEIGFHNPYFIVFHGSELSTGRTVKFVQHVSQLAVLFVAVPKEPTHETPRRIGFAATATIPESSAPEESA